MFYFTLYQEAWCEMDKRTRKERERERVEKEKWYDSIAQTNLTIIDSDSDGERKKNNHTNYTAHAIR